MMGNRKLWLAVAASAVGCFVGLAPSSHADHNSQPVHQNCRSEFNNSGPQSDPHTAAPDTKIQVAPGVWVYAGSVNWSNQDTPPGNDDSGYNGVYLGDNDGTDSDDQYVEYSGNHGGSRHGPHHYGAHAKTHATGRLCVEQPL